MDILDFLMQKKILFVFPHPDDESYSSTVLIRRLLREKNQIFVIYLSTGVPREEEYASPMKDKYEYSKYLSVREEEFRKSLEAIGVDKRYVLSLEYTTRDSMLYLKKIINKLEEFVKKYRIEIFFTSPYEGAHPDHDICSFLGSLIKNRHKNIISMEYLGYFLREGKFSFGDFLNFPQEPIFQLPLSNEDIYLKRKIYGIYKSQAIILNSFKMLPEKFRKKPDYNYSKPPSREIFYMSWQNKVNPIQVVDKIAAFNAI